MLFTEPIVLNKDFLRLYRKGASRVHPILVTYVCPNRLGRNRLGLTASKKVGCAVERNRCRRIMREAYRLLEPTLTPGWDIIFVARGRTKSCSMNQIHGVMAGHLRQLTSHPSKKS